MVRVGVGLRVRMGWVAVVGMGWVSLSRVGMGWVCGQDGEGLSRRDGVGFHEIVDDEKILTFRGRYLLCRRYL